MSRNNRNKAPKRNFLLPLLLLGAVMLALAAFLFVQQMGAGTPVLVVDPERIDFGDVRYNTPLSFTITVTNQGSGTLRFTEQPYIEVRQGC
ncbi:MAG: hypothetical protein ANABAC_3516 [Anaerolineae bacterium]|jgi:hypothetical protein|nr:MAG: hypothetical protein ANABAC_3516 [Anaerolineae bacterium]